MATAKSKTKTSYACTACGATSLRWQGKCNDCGSWGTVEESAGPSAAAVTVSKPVASPAQSIVDVRGISTSHVSTGVSEFDRVLGGGLVPGSVVLLAGEPGAGKSTLVLDLAAKMAGTGKSVLYVTGEESAGQVRMRAERIGALHPNLLLAAETDLGVVLSHIEQASPDLVIVDSVQTIGSVEVDGLPGNTSQVREVAGSLISAAKSRSIACVMIGHVTKEGNLAGPRLLEHLVDVVCQFEGDRHARLRMVRAVKNRFGSTDEVGCFELTDTGIEGLADPSALFMSGHSAAYGTCVALTLEGKRPLAAEVQALTTPPAAKYPKRTTSGIEPNRIAMISALLGKRVARPLAEVDVFCSTVGGVRLTEPAADLAIALAMVSAWTERPTGHETACFGEVSLSGEVRAVTGVPRRINEAARLGFKRVIVPAARAKDLPCPDGVQVIGVSMIDDAITALGLNSRG